MEPVEKQTTKPELGATEHSMPMKLPQVGFQAIAVIVLLLLVILEVILNLAPHYIK
jgi:hypothetical protein